MAWDGGFNPDPVIYCEQHKPNNSVVLGDTTRATLSNCVCIGTTATCTEDGEIAIGEGLHFYRSGLIIFKDRIFYGDPEEVSELCKYMHEGLQKMFMSFR